MKKKFSLLLPLILMGCLTALGGQQDSSADHKATQGEETSVQNSTDAKKRSRPPKDEDVVRISVTLVQVDAVVTDRQGKPVTDLKSSDFEIFEDGRKQHITNFSFVGTTADPSIAGSSTAAASAPPNPEPRPKGPLPPGPPTRLRPDQVRRTIALVVDDLVYLDYAFLIYNAQIDPKPNRPQLESQVLLLKDGKQIFAGNMNAIGVGEQPDLKRIPASGRLRLGTDLARGEYVLQIIITDKLAKEKYRSATQWMDFEITK
jgi:hypothetical protein